jgi:hypothetical protein
MEREIVLEGRQTFDFGHRLPVAAENYGGILRWHPSSNVQDSTPLMRHFGRLWQPMFTVRESIAKHARLIICAHEVERPRVCAQFIEFEPQSPILAEILCLCLAAHCREIHSKVYFHLFKSPACQKMNGSPSMSYLRSCAKLSPLLNKAFVTFPEKDVTMFRIARFISYIGASVRLNLRFCASYEEFDKLYNATSFDDYKSLALDEPYMSELAKTASKLAAQYPEDSWDASLLKLKHRPSSRHLKSSDQPAVSNSLHDTDSASAQGSESDNLAVISEGDENRRDSESTLHAVETNG